MSTRNENLPPGVSQRDLEPQDRETMVAADDCAADYAYEKAKDEEIMRRIDSPTAPRVGGWFLTASGLQFWPMSPRVEDVRLYDIAHALSHCCRFAGHCREFYSVAAHSLHVAALVERKSPGNYDLIIQALLHDATEAYIGDLVAPFKANLPEYREVEARLWTVIAARFRLNPEFDGDPIIKWADRTALMTERRDLLLDSPHAWNISTAPDASAHLTPFAPSDTRDAFLHRFFELEGFRACKEAL